MNSLNSFGKNSKERVENAVEKLKQGFGILLVDDENRENEGDIIFSAEKMTEKDMALMIRECSGIVCICLTEKKCNSLGLRQMVETNTSKNKTAFTISIEAKSGVTTGVSAKDRLTTIKTAIQENATPKDLSSPGHVFPLLAQENGVFARRGHTEGSVDLMKIANLGEYAVLCELTNEDGTMSRLPEVCLFAKKHNMTVVSIDDICQYREMTEKKEIAIEMTNS
ncbi:MAG: 3,4-dihydroxy-2-butanone-4-phosphate synthase [Lutibacter sp.]|nr:3,4-dihydroxy-2-butanone-4-phosphate synthase [Lutibacter sp.]MBP9600680.1 3,4-dihydroxy-2-butanone-4-phosphate synthase [Lutibacter sp.]